MDSPMLDDRWSSMWAVFHEVVEQPSEKRALLLAEACGDDTELRREIEELLAVHDDGVPILDESVFDLAPTLPSSGNADDSPSLRPGTLLAGRFEIAEGIAVGGMGEVYRAYDRELGRDVALKTLVAGRRGSASALARFRREIHLAQQVTHRNVCRVFDLVRDGNLLFLTMEMLEGETLSERLERDGTFILSETKTILNQIVEGLEAAHAVGVIHRDLKPSNVMLVEDSAGLRAVVTDFGLATSGSLGSDDDPRITRTGELMGTPAYMAPEQLEGNEVSPATDVYAIGLLLYEMVTGKRPFSGGSTFSVASRRLDTAPPSPRTHAPELDERWERAILRCLERRPEDRFQHPREIIEALEDATIPLVVSSSAGRKLLRVVPLVALAAVVLGAGIWLWLVRPESSLEVQDGAGRPGLGFEERDAVIVADFDNRTGNASLDGALSVALARELAGSTFMNVASRGRIADSMKLMRLDPDATVDVETARQVALRDGFIRAVIGGTAEKAGSEFVLTANLIAPADGRILQTWSEQTSGDISGVPAALERIALSIRKHLGENPAQIASSGGGLKKVTTPSLRALRLYDQADVAIAAGRSDAAEEFLRDAIREDPQFASAHILLAYTLANQDRPREEYVPHAKRAMELAAEVPDRERYFIRASYYDFIGDEEKRTANYEALLRLHPDHFWANNNIAFYLDGTAAVPYLVRAAQSRPRSLRINFTAAHALAIIANRPEEARPVVDRVIELVESDTQLPWHYSPFPAWARLWKAHRHWVLGEVEESKKELDHWSGELERLSGGEEWWMRALLIRSYRNLGMADRAMELALPAEFRITRPYLRGLDAYFAGDHEKAFENFTAPVWKDQREKDLLRAPLRIAGLARSGRTEEAAEVLASFRQLPTPDRFGRKSVALESRLAGELILAEGRYHEAVNYLEKEAFREESNRWGSMIEGYGSSYFLAAQALSIAYRHLGRDDDAIAILEQAVAERERSYPNGTEVWMDTQLRLVMLYRELGRAAEAERLERELRSLMRFADDEFWLVRRLEEQASAGP